jgi:hypothetical protein
MVELISENVEQVYPRECFPSPQKGGSETLNLRIL